ASVKVSRLRERTVTRGKGRVTISESIIEYRLWPKLEAIGKLARHLGLDTEVTPIEGLLAMLPRNLALQVRDALLASNGKSRIASSTAPSTNGSVPPVPVLAGGDAPPTEPPTGG